MVREPRTVCLTVSECSLFLTCHFSSERSVREFLVVKTLPHDQVSPLDRFTQYERGEQEGHKDNRCQDVSHMGIVTGNGLTENGGDGRMGDMQGV